MRYLYLLLLLFPLPTLAQTPLPPENRTPTSARANETATLAEENLPPKLESPRSPADNWAARPATERKAIFDKKFNTLMMALNISAVLDVESSYHTLKNCPRGYVCREGNPMLRPFVNSGRPAAYGFMAGTNVLAIWSSYYLRKKGNRFWWAPMTLYIGVHTFAAAKNFHTTTK